MDQLSELENTFIEEFESAELLLNKGRLKSAVILFSKSLFALVDFFIFKKYYKLPQNHSERFRILENKEEKMYFLVDEVWDKYTDAYSKPSLNNSITLLKDNIKRIILENEDFSKKIKKIIKE